MCQKNLDFMTASKEAVLEDWARARAELDESFLHLTPADLSEQGMTGVWDGRMTLVHIARWDETTTAMVLRHRQGFLPGENEFDDYEAWNLVWAEIDADIPLEAAWQRYHSAHEAIVRTLRHMPEEEWDDYVRGWIREASINHYRHHAETTRRWREAREAK